MNKTALTYDHNIATTKIGRLRAWDLADLFKSWNIRNFDLHNAIIRMNIQVIREGLENGIYRTWVSDATASWLYRSFH
ncbi:TPA: hypothetical protein H1802_003222 [Salmonella enterica]|nr:hypothetical protein [Salmonella enterica]